jgi:hypothetical protein
MDKMRELIGQEFLYGDKTVKVTDVRKDANVFGGVIGYVIYTNNGSRYDDFHQYPGISSYKRTKLSLPDEYMEDIRQASELQIKLEADNEARLKSLRKQSLSERDISNLRVFMDTSYSFHFGASLTIAVHIENGVGSFEFPLNKDEGKTIEMSDEQITGFYQLYKDFDFFEEHEEMRQGLDGWDLRYTACAGETYFQHRLWCPEPGDAVWTLIEYALKLSKEYLPPELYKKRFSLLKRYCGSL